jgi:hypothetical protein
VQLKNEDQAAACEIRSKPRPRQREPNGDTKTGAGSQAAKTRAVQKGNLRSDPARENEKLGNRGGKTKAESEKTNAALTAAAIKTGREKPGMRKSTEDQNRQERRSVETRSNPTQLLAEESATSARADRTTKKVSTARAGETVDQI